MRSPRELLINEWLNPWQKYITDVCLTLATESTDLQPK